MKTPLHVLCQSPVSSGMSPREAVGNTVSLAKAAEAWGYHGFWVAEHHSDTALAGAAPEILLAHIASITERMGVGAAGILLPYYSPLKVAEQFNMLATLFPHRIHLGMGRAGGSEGHAPQSLGVRNPPSRAFDALDEVLSWLGRGAADRPFGDTFASPRVEEPATPWVLGTSAASARQAGRRGLPYAFGGFLDPRGLMPALAAYHQSFRPSRWLQKPRVNVAWYVQAADTEAEAQWLTTSSEQWFVETLLRGENRPFPVPDQQAESRYAPMEKMAVAMRRQYALIGTGEQVVEGLATLARDTMADELTLVTIPHDHAARMRSYQLIAEAAGLVAPA